jgi:glycosyltransferase involved in cell wall biosynthesis
MPTVSICLPVYNGAKYLAESLESVLSQTYPDFELLIGNDCSKDESQNIIESYGKRDKRIKAWTNATNLGHYPNYNSCLEKASGQLIKLFAQDDILRPGMLGRMVQAFNDNPKISLAATARTWIDGQGHTIPVESQIDIKLTKPFNRDTTIPGKEALVLTLMECTNWIGEPSNQMFRAEFLDGGFDTSFNQIGDLEYNYRLLERGDYYFIADELCLFRKHSNSWTKSNNAELRTYLDWLLLGAKYRKYLSQAGITSEEFCLNFMKDWTRNLECELNQVKRLSWQERGMVLRQLIGNVDPLSLFNPDRHAKRDLTSEYRLLGALALLQSSLLENEIRVIHTETARPYYDTDLPHNPVFGIRPGLAAALEGMKETLRERDKEIQSLRRALDEMGNSRSWKMTEPLRRLKGRMN